MSGLEERKDTYKEAVRTLADGSITTLILVSRPETAPLKEAERAAKELSELGIKNQRLIVNGVLPSFDDSISEGLYKKQRSALTALPEILKGLTTFMRPKPQ